jgi:tripartite ATP-independent transporter DctM subunit
VSHGILSLLARLERFGKLAENAALVVLLGSLVLLAVGQIILREVFETGFFRADELIKLLVLWLAMVGSIAATRDNRHSLAGLAIPAAGNRIRRYGVNRCASVDCTRHCAGRVCIDELPVCCFCHTRNLPDGDGQEEAGDFMIALTVILALLAILGAPLFAVIATSAMLGFQRDETDLMNIALEVLSIADLPFLAAIPLFTFAGYLLSESNAPRRLVRLTDALLGWMPGGLALVSLAACAFFTAFTGASGVTIIALGAILYPALQQDGYPDKFNLGLVTSSGSLGLLFAPSLPLILYGVIAEVSIDYLFLAGILPGLLMLVMLSGWSLFVSRSSPKVLQKFSMREFGRAVRETAWEIPLPLVVLGGIYSGFLAVSEAAAITALYVFVVEVLIHREIRFSELPRIIRESMVLVGGILAILGVSLASTNYMISAGVPQELLASVSGLVSSQTTFLVLLLVFLLVLGALIDIFSAIVLVVPLILPIAAAYNVDPVHLGIVFLAAMQLGYMTPPVGLNLFIASYRFEKPIMHVYSATFPFLVILMLSVLVITFWPGLSLFLVPG